MNLGEQIGQYRVTQLLGEGGMGAVYKAIDTMIEREVAIKVLRPEIGRNANLLQRFRAEAVTLARLNHSGIATLYSFQQYGDEFLMIMEYVPGKTLEAIERERGTLAPELAVPLFIRILEAIGPAHESGILHRDIKPANIMLTTWGAVKVMDFGIARIAGAARQTRQGALVGTMEYIAPERVKGSEGDIRSDIYALGIVLYEMLSGRLPFNSPNEFELMKLHLEAQPPSLASHGLALSPALEAVLQRALAKNPEQRYESCESMAEALRAAAGDTRLSRGDLVALVGKPAVEELGTAGHLSSISGETLSLAQPGPEPSKRQAPSQSSPDQKVASQGAMSRLRQYRTPVLAAAALAFAIGGGIAAGKLIHHDDPAVPASEPATTVDEPHPVDTVAPERQSESPLQTEPTPTTQTIPTESSPIAPVQDPASKTDPAPAKAHHKTLHDRSLKALDE